MIGSGDGNLERIIAAFESDWLDAPPANLRQYLERVASLIEPAAVNEILAVDLEYRWRSKRGSLQDELGGQPRIDDYVQQLKTFDIAFVPDGQTVAEEYRVRSLWGDRPSIAHLQQRFPSLAEELAMLCSRIDAELTAEHNPPTRPSLEFDPRAPLRYEDFEILKLIGAGATGKVYRSRQKSLDRVVALKSLHRALQLDEWAINAFLREGQIVASLNHPGIAQVYGMGRFPNGGYFQVIEFIDGIDLRQKLNASDHITQCEHLRIVSAVATAIAFAHQQDVIHCDIKPENILLSNDRVVLTDFGFARLNRPNAESIVQGGTPRYMAPEVVDDVPGSVTPAVDVYAVGRVWEDLSNNTPDVDAASDELHVLRTRCRSHVIEDRPSAKDLSRVLQEHLSD